ncbi:hypothetical protein ES708_03861 [subsurface metagenome]
MIHTHKSIIIGIRLKCIEKAISALYKAVEINPKLAISWR